MDHYRKNFADEIGKGRPKQKDLSSWVYSSHKKHVLSHIQVIQGNEEF